MALTPPTRPQGSPALKLHIEELVLHGFASGDRRRIGAAVERELSRLLTEAGPHTLSLGSLHLGHIDAGSFRIASSADPHSIGNQIAGSVFSQLTQPQRSTQRSAQPSAPLSVPLSEGAPHA